MKNKIFQPVRLLRILAAVSLLLPGWNSVFAQPGAGQETTANAMAGFAEIVITPPKVSGGAGYCSSYEIKGVHDDLFACAAYFSKGGHRVLLVSFDLGSLRTTIAGRLREEIGKKYGLAEDAIFFTCTHTHNSKGGGPEYTDFLVQQVLAVCGEAMEAAIEFDLGANFSYVDENVHRTFFLQDGTHLYTPHHKMLLPITGRHTDKQLYALYFFDRKEVQNPCQRQPYGVIVNYTVHPVCTGHTLYVSADFPGVLRKEIRESLDCPSLYITGAAGDNHPKRPESGFAEARRVGERLASEVIMMRYDADFIPNSEIELDYMTGSMKARTVTKEEYEDIPKKIHDSLKEWKFRDPPPPKDVEIAYSVLALGPVCFFGVPGEWDSELGSALKWFSPFKRNLVLYNSTGPGGYFMHPNNYAWGGRETYNPPIAPRYMRPLFNRMVDAAEMLYDR